MSALGQKRTSAHFRVTSALPPQADIHRYLRPTRRESCSALDARSLGAHLGQVGCSEVTMSERLYEETGAAWVY